MSERRRVFLVTGGSRGIGAAVALAAAREGYVVLLTYVSQKSAADGVVERIRAQGGEAHALQVDTAKDDEVRGLFVEVDRLGPLSALVHNGGITGPASRSPRRRHVPGKLDRIGKGLPVQRAGEPEEVASAVMYPVSDAASYVSGANLAVAGAR
jgi:NAD(P)-dependent dehydrogenase (short-subunit alcohol dehydrogenase family)